jgi:hypothetical protein
MSTGNQKRQRKRSTRVRRTSRTPMHDNSTLPEGEPNHEPAREHYRREKARRAERVRPPEHPLEQARRAYHALLAADAERARGGRPKKTAATATRKPRAVESEPEADK